MAASASSLAAALERTLLPVAAAASLRVPGRVDAAVLVALFVRDGEPGTVLIERRHDLRRHPGEIAFPGGRRDEGDPDLLFTALRESQEEIGLPPDAVSVLGALQPTPTIATGYRVYPFVGLIEPAAAWTVSPREVAHVLELPLSTVRAGYGRRRLLRRGIPIRTDSYLVGERLIWGATARILADLFDRLTGLPQEAGEPSSSPLTASRAAATQPSTAEGSASSSV